MLSNTENNEEEAENYLKEELNLSIKQLLDDRSTLSKPRVRRLEDRST